jgi:abortive infection bacteriophage resistance protein
MSKIPFTKLPLTYEQQVSLLKERGLNIENEPKLLHLLQVISYYRLSGYWYPLLSDKQNHSFKEGACFESAFNLYKFDRELRLLIMRELEKIEVAVRAKMIYVLSHKYGPFWYTDSSIFYSPVKHAETLSKIGAEFNRGDEDFIRAFSEKYSDPLPPSWMMLEVSSFGNLSSFFSALKPFRHKRDIANFFGLNEATFSSWLHSIVYLRNICAHHTRLWNKDLRIQPNIPQNPHFPFLTKTTYTHSETQKELQLNNKAYFVISMIIYLMNIINPKHKIIEKFMSLIERYPNVDPRAMGFPSDWQSEPIWKIK